MQENLTQSVISIKAKILDLGGQFSKNFWKVLKNGQTVKSMTFPNKITFCVKYLDKTANSLDRSFP